MSSLSFLLLSLAAHMTQAYDQTRAGCFLPAAETQAEPQAQLSSEGWYTGEQVTQAKIFTIIKIEILQLFCSLQQSPNSFCRQAHTHTAVHANYSRGRKSHLTKTPSTHTSHRAEPSPRRARNHHSLLTTKFWVSADAMCAQSPGEGPCCHLLHQICGLCERRWALLPCQSCPSSVYHTHARCHQNLG